MQAVSQIKVKFETVKQCRNMLELMVNILE